MDNFIVVSCTKSNEEEFWKTPLGVSIIKHNIKNYRIFYNNKNGISECYNTFLKEVEYEFKHKYVLFLHDDLYLNDVYMFDKLKKAFKDYDVVGIAGSAEFSISKGLNSCGLVAWHVCGDKKNWAGFVEHPLKDDNSRFNCNSFGDCPKKCLVIDGLFIAVKLESIRGKGIKFDERFKFDFYDTDFSLTCHVNNLKTVIYNIYCTHMSHGYGLLKESYKKSQEIFLNKWRKNGR